MDQKPIDDQQDFVQEQNPSNTVPYTKKKLLLKILFIGDQKVGKTSLIKLHAGLGFTERYRASVGADYTSTKVVIDEQVLELQIWELAGQEELPTYGNAFFRGADCCVLVYDITNPKSFDSIEQKRNQYLIQAQSKDQNFPFILIGNKLDQVAERKVEASKAQEWCQQYGNILFFETSVLDGTNVQYAFQQIAKSAAREIEKQEKDLFPIMKYQQLTSPQKQSGCY